LPYSLISGTDLDWAWEGKGAFMIYLLSSPSPQNVLTSSTPFPIVREDTP